MTATGRIIPPTGGSGTAPPKGAESPPAGTGAPTFATPTYYLRCHYKIDDHDVNWEFAAPTLAGLCRLVEAVKPGMFRAAPAEPDEPTIRTDSSP